MSFKTNMHGNHEQMISWYALCNDSDLLCQLVERYSSNCLEFFTSVFHAVVKFGKVFRDFKQLTFRLKLHQYIDNIGKYGESYHLQKRFLT